MRLYVLVNDIDDDTLNRVEILCSAHGDDNDVDDEGKEDTAVSGSCKGDPFPQQGMQYSYFQHFISATAKTS